MALGMKLNFVGIPTAIRKLLVACWHHHPDNRPTPAQLVLMLEKVKLKLTIEDKNARKFWKKHWPEHSTVLIRCFRPHNRSRLRFQRFLENC